MQAIHPLLSVSPFSLSLPSLTWNSHLFSLTSSLSLFTTPLLANHRVPVNHVHGHRHVWILFGDFSLRAQNFGKDGQVLHGHALIGLWGMWPYQRKQQEVDSLQERLEGSSSKGGPQAEASSGRMRSRASFTGRRSTAPDLGANIPSQSAIDQVMNFAIAFRLFSPLSFPFHLFSLCPAKASVTIFTKDSLAPPLTQVSQSPAPPLRQVFSFASTPLSFQVSSACPLMWPYPSLEYPSPACPSFTSRLLLRDASPREHPFHVPCLLLLFLSSSS